MEKCEGSKNLILIIKIPSRRNLAFLLCTNECDIHGGICMNYLKSVWSGIYETIMYLKAPESIGDYQEVRNVPPVDHQPPTPDLKKGIKSSPI